MASTPEPPEPPEPSDFERHLGQQLDEAAHRLYGSRPAALRAPASTRRRTRRPVLRLALAAAVVAAVLPAVVLLDGRSQPADAEAFQLVYDQGSLTVQVIDAVHDRAAAERQLAERGIDADFFDVPTPDALVDQLVVIEATPQPLRTEQHDGRISSFTVPSNYQGSLRIGLGRPAGPGEPYGATGPHERCGDFVDRSLAEVAILVGQLAPHVVWERLDGSGRLVGRTSEPPVDGFVAGLLPVADDELWVLVTPEPGVFADPC